MAASAQHTTIQSRCPEATSTEHDAGGRCYRFFTAVTTFFFGIFFLAGAADRGGAERSTLGLSMHHIGLTVASPGNAISTDECTD
jgi:hypothetical protein